MTTLLARAVTIICCEVDLQEGDDLNVRFWHLADIECRPAVCPLLGAKRTLLIRALMSADDPKWTFANCHQWGSSRRFNLKRMGDRITPPTTKIVTPATASRMLNGSSSRLARRGREESGMWSRRQWPCCLRPDAVCVSQSWRRDHRPWQRSRPEFRRSIQARSTPRKWTLPKPTARCRGWFLRARIRVGHRQSERRRRADEQTQLQGVSWRRQRSRWPPPVGSATAAIGSHA